MTEHPIMEYLAQVNSEQVLLEELLDQVLDNDDKMRITAARVQAARDIRFDLLKLIEENDHSGGRVEVPSKEQPKK